MTAENFVYWLQGFIEVAKPKMMTEDQVEMVKSHIALVLTEVTWPINPVLPSTLPVTLELLEKMQQSPTEAQLTKMQQSPTETHPKKMQQSLTEFLDQLKKTQITCGSTYC